MFWRRRNREKDAPLRRPGAAVSFRDRVRHGSRAIVEEAIPWLSVVFLVLIIAVPLVLFIWFLFFTNVFTVQAVTILDAREHTAATAEELIDNRLQTATSEPNIFFVQTESLETVIANALPQVRTVRVTRQLPGTIKVVIQEKEPALLLLSSSDYYFVDSEGIPYEEARLDTLPGIVLPTVKNNDQGSRVTLGVPAVDSAFVNFVIEVEKRLPDALNANVVETRIPSLAAREVHFLMDNNWQLRFDVTRDPTAQVEILRRVAEEIITPEERATLEYIDLRIPDRVYYQAAVNAGIAPTSTTPSTNPTPTPSLAPNPTDNL